MKNLTAIVIGFGRPEYTRDCIQSLRESYPKIKIAVGDQSDDESIRQACERYDATYMKLPHDHGVGPSRNRLIENIDTEYVLVGDDDFLYDENAKVPEMLKFLKYRKSFDLIGGRVLEGGRVKDYQGFIDIHPDHLHYHMVRENEVEEVDKRSGLRFKEVDLTFNFFVARTEVCKEVPWDENIKCSFEHSHWFIHLKKAGKKVAFSPDPIVKHKYQNYPVTQDYKNYRYRRSDKHYFFDSLGIDYSIGITGAKAHKDPVGHQKYYVIEPVSLNGRKNGRGDIVLVEDYDSLPKGIKQKIKKA